MRISVQSSCSLPIDWCNNIVELLLKLAVVTNIYNDLKMRHNVSLASAVLCGFAAVTLCGGASVVGAFPSFHCRDPRTCATLFKVQQVAAEAQKFTR